MMPSSLKAHVVESSYVRTAMVAMKSGTPELRGDSGSDRGDSGQGKLGLTPPTATSGYAN